MLELFIEVDTNDGDYISSTSKITSVQLAELIPIIEVIKKTSGHNYSVGECAEMPMTEKYPQFPKEVHEDLQELCPYCEYGFHTIVYITVCPWVEKTKLL